MVDYKYHAITLVAVFLALGIGILIGSMMLDSDFLVENQKTLIDRLEDDFRQMRVQNSLTRGSLSAAQEMTNTYRTFCNDVLPVLIKDKLKGVRVALIQTNPDSNLEDIAGCLGLAGAEISSVTSVLDDLSLAEASGPLPANLPQGKELVQLLGETILCGDEVQAVPALAERNVRITGTVGEPIDAVVIVGGSDSDQGEQAKWLDSALLDYFLANKIRVVGVEPSTVSCSYMSIYQEKQVSTVDNVEMTPGKVALVYALSGEDGNFGVKNTARRLVPAMTGE